MVNCAGGRFTCREAASIPPMNTDRDLADLISNMQPVLNPGRYAFAVLPAGTALQELPLLACMREAEGMTVIVDEESAIASALSIRFTAAWITLSVQSDLSAVGLTAAFSSALAKAGISCNVVAGVFHDHLFVPVDQAAQAMLALHALQQAILPILHNPDLPS